MTMQCGCAVADWRAFRLVLELTQPEFAVVVGMSDRAVRLLETANGHRCLPHGSRIALRLWLLLLPSVSPWRAERLREAGYGALVDDGNDDLRAAATVLGTAMLRKGAA